VWCMVRAARGVREVYMGAVHGAQEVHVGAVHGACGAWCAGGACGCSA
jgi:hypothetical protein